MPAFSAMVVINDFVVSTIEGNRIDSRDISVFPASITDNSST